MKTKPNTKRHHATAFTDSDSSSSTDGGAYVLLTATQPTPEVEPLPLPVRFGARTPTKIARSTPSRRNRALWMYFTLDQDFVKKRDNDCAKVFSTPILFIPSVLLDH